MKLLELFVAEVGELSSVEGLDLVGCTLEQGPAGAVGRTRTTRRSTCDLVRSSRPAASRRLTSRLTSEALVTSPSEIEPKGIPCSSSWRQATHMTGYCAAVSP